MYAISSNIEIAPTLTSGGTAISGPVAKNTSVTFTIDTSSIKVQKNGSELVASAYTLEYEWATGFSAQTANPNIAVYSVTGDTTATCTINVKVGNDVKCSTIARSNRITVYDLDNAIDKVYFNNRPYTVTNKSATVFLGDKEEFNKGTWLVVPKDGYVIEANSTKFENNQLKFKVGYGESVAPAEMSIDIATGTHTAPTVSITKPTGISNNTVRTNQEVVFSAAVTNKSSNTKYSWTIQDTANGAAVATPSNPSSSNTYNWVPTKEGTYKVSCTLYEGDVVTTVKSSEVTVTVERTTPLLPSPIAPPCCRTALRCFLSRSRTRMQRVRPSLSKLPRWATLSGLLILLPLATHSPRTPPTRRRPRSRLVLLLPRITLSRQRSPIRISPMRSFITFPRRP